MVFARLYYGGPLLGVDLAVARKCEPLSVDICLPCDACILGGFSRCFLRFFWLVLVFLGRVQQELQKKNQVNKVIYSYGIPNNAFFSLKKMIIRPKNT